MIPDIQPSIGKINLKECGNGGEDNTSGKPLEGKKQLTETDPSAVNTNGLHSSKIKQKNTASPNTSSDRNDSRNSSGKEPPNYISERFNYTYKLVGEVAINLQKICLILIVVSVYIAFTLSHIEDQHLFIKHTQIELPILNIKVSGSFFLLLAQLFLLFIFLYFQIYRKHIISLIDDLPAEFPDGVKRSGILHPWILLMRLNRMEEREFNPISSAKWTSAVSDFLTWVLVPLISALILLRTLKSQNATLSISVCVIFLVMCFVTFISNNWVKSENGDKDIKTRYGIKDIKTWIFFLIIPGIAIFSTLLGIKGNLLPFNFENAALEEMDLSEFNLKRANLNGANLENARLCNVNLKNASLDRAKCKGANFNFANLSGAFLNFSKLMEAKFISTKFIKAHLIRANLSETDLSGAEFKGAVLNSTNFTGADLKDAKFDGANLTSANFKGAKNLTVDQLAEAKTLRYAQFDQELEKQIRKEYPGLLE
jgi:uncharacterized protein YjbI with pentapeptide repeats